MPLHKHKTKPCGHFFVVSSYALCLLLLAACSNNDSRAEQTRHHMTQTRINGGITAQLTLPKQVKLKLPINIQFELKNHYASPITLLTWGTPLEGKFTRNLFHISKQEQTIAYIGRNIKRGTPTATDFITLAPHSSIKATIDLQQGYNIQTTGHYKISLNLSHLQSKAKQKITLEPIITGAPIYVDIQ